MGIIEAIKQLEKSELENFNKVFKDLVNMDFKLEKEFELDNTKETAFHSALKFNSAVNNTYYISSINESYDDNDNYNEECEESRIVEYTRSYFILEVAGVFKFIEVMVDYHYIEQLVSTMSEEVFIEKTGISQKRINKVKVAKISKKINNF
jgi:hypothetical protein